MSPRKPADPLEGRLQTRAARPLVAGMGPAPSLGQLLRRPPLLLPSQLPLRSKIPAVFSPCGLRAAILQHERVSSKLSLGRAGTLDSNRRKFFALLIAVFAD